MMVETVLTTYLTVDKYAMPSQIIHIFSRNCYTLLLAAIWWVSKTMPGFDLYAPQNTTNAIQVQRCQPLSYTQRLSNKTKLTSGIINYYTKNSSALSDPMRATSVVLPSLAPILVLGKLNRSVLQLISHELQHVFIG